MTFKPKLDIIGAGLAQIRDALLKHYTYGKSLVIGMKKRHTIFYIFCIMIL